jgi:Na+/H+ antiporter
MSVSNLLCCAGKGECLIYLIEGMIGLLVAATVLAVVARRLDLPYPILLVIGGLLLAFVPGLPRPKLDPQMVFFLFLPPLLFAPALFSSWRDLHNNLRPILMLAVALVLFTTVVIGYLATVLIPGLPLAAGMLLGAIISPPDAIAATSIAERLNLPKRIVTLIEGESLINDATALVTYKFAIAAVITGSFSLSHAAGTFFLVSLGGVGIGLLIALGIAWLEVRLDHAPVQTTLSLLAPFVAYVAAENVGVSGVLSVVTSGIYLGWRSPEIVTARMRLQAGPVWEMIEFLLNGIVFILIGLQLPDILKGLGHYNNWQLAYYAIAVNVAVILLRIIWIFPSTYISWYFVRFFCKDRTYPKWQNVGVVAWTGMRGVISLAAAMGVPLTMGGGVEFPGRNLILFLTFTVILGTLVLQGLSLPTLIRWLGVTDDGAARKEEQNARFRANEAALQKLNELAEEEGADPHAVERLRAEYEDRLRQVRRDEGEQSSLFSTDYERLAFEALQVERETILQLRNEQIISDHVLRKIQRDIDLAEARLRFPNETKE